MGALLNVIEMWLKCDWKWLKYFWLISIRMWLLSIEIPLQSISITINQDQSLHEFSDDSACPKSHILCCVFPVWLILPSGWCTGVCLNTVFKWLCQELSETGVTCLTTGFFSILWSLQNKFSKNASCLELVKRLLQYWCGHCIPSAAAHVHVCFPLS